MVDGKFDKMIAINVGHALVEFQRASVMGPAAPCVYCKVPTDRALIFRLRNEINPRLVRSCNGCHDGIRKVPAADGEAPGIIRGV